MAALLNDPPLVEDQDIPAEPAGGEPVGDVEGGFPRRAGRFGRPARTGRISVSFSAHHPVEAFLNLAFGERVQGGGGFVHDDEGSVFIDRPRDGHFLFFSAGEGNAFIGVFLSHPGMKPLRKPL